MTDEISWRVKLQSLYRASTYRPKLALAVIVLSVVAALLEGIGLTFILPIIEIAQGEVDPDEASGVLAVFLTAYEFLGIPFTLGWLILGISGVMTIRFTASFLVGWLRGAIETHYIRHLQREAFEHAMIAEVAYFDQEGSDDILNAIVTQAEYAGRVLRWIIVVFEQLLLSILYIAIALYLAPVLTLVAAVAFVALTYLFRNVLEEGYSIGDRVADANERIQEYAQAGTQGIRDVKLYGVADELISDFRESVDTFTAARVRYFRNREAIRNYYNLATAVMLFALIYGGLYFSGMALSQLGVFLFAMFRLGPTVSTLNQRIYDVEGELAHLVRTQRFVEELRNRSEYQSASEPVPDKIHKIEFEDVNFAYPTEEGTVLGDISFSVEHGEFIAFVGQSGAGKSTIVSLLARLYEPDSGTITANGTPIDHFDLTEWRSKIAVVRQHPHIFNDTLRSNVTIGNRNATQSEIERACKIAQVTEFLNELPDGYETELGDEGVRLSGGQRQRVSLARALLKNADVLVLDEATSDLDSNLEQQVQLAIEAMESEYAIIGIAHRLSTVMNADRIYSISDGEILESGTHQYLLENDGEYAELYRIQSEG